MVYDSADVMDVPWEIIVKEFRRELGKSHYETLQEYAEHFWRYIAENENLIPNTNKANYIAAQAFGYADIIYSEMENIAKQTIVSEGATSIAQTVGDLRGIVTRHKEIITEAEFADDFNATDAAAILIENREVFEEVAKRKLGMAYSELDNESQVDLLKLFSLVFTKDRFLLRRSGVVIAGYGTKEIFPKISSHIVEGVVNGKVRKLFQEGKSNVQHDVFLTTIVPFAQDEMVWTFLTGLDPEIVEFADKYLQEIFRIYPGYINKDKFGFGDDALNAIKLDLLQGGQTLFDDFKKKLSEFQRENNTQPILDMVAVLPKDELAAMAESLVNLTVFKRKISKSVESVGGPIDVAVISKGDGFIWVKRKHYFKRELNQHFFANYYGGNC